MLKGMKNESKKMSNILCRRQLAIDSWREVMKKDREEWKSERERDEREVWGGGPVVQGM